ncbi:MAG: ZIP family metal transporter [Deltaproteobacteria bacterium]|nr:ZIP family metal transporter [Deltaproteobacteria bacterium]
MPVFVVGLLASVAASAGTGVGALPVLGLRQVSQRAQDILQSIAAGIMLAATVFSLITPGIAAASARFGSQASGALIISASAIFGALAVLLVNRYAPHEHFLIGPQGPPSHRLRRTWLFVIAITIHNFPEGLSVGVGFGGGDVANGLELTTAIFLQNIPEGLVVALGLLGAGYRAPFSVFVSFATGFVETLGGLVGAAAVSLAASFLPWGLGFAAGAMLFVISHEIIPETHRNGFEEDATFGLLGGFLMMVVLGAALG